MIRLTSLAGLERLYAARGHLAYGESVTQSEHALQCAALAEAAAAPPALVLAALLHDVGHLLSGEAEQDVDDRHEAAGAAALEDLFPLAVTAPIALHVQAKRYLCFTEEGYRFALSSASRRSLAAQGGAFDARQARAFESDPHAQAAVALRRWDDGGKREDIRTRSFADYAPLLSFLAAHP